MSSSSTTCGRPPWHGRRPGAPSPIWKRSGFLRPSWCRAPATGATGECATTAHGQTAWAPSRSWRSPRPGRNPSSRWRGPPCMSSPTCWPAGVQATGRSGSMPASASACGGPWPRDSATSWRRWRRRSEPRSPGWWRAWSTATRLSWPHSAPSGSPRLPSPARPASV
jgi:hypothetical protein